MLNKVCCFSSGADALEASIAAVSKYGGASAGYRTMLDALIPASTVLKQVTSQTYLLCRHHYL
jgi:dihydroxyacetone kinase